MTDNIRPALYGSEYEALVANRPGDGDRPVTLSGKYCESGDVLIRDAVLPEVEAGDIVAIPASGAYNLAMASNYNSAARPAVVFVRGRRGSARPPPRNLRRPPRHRSSLPPRRSLALAWSVFGQARATSQLQAALENPAHAYLFAGPEGSGLRLLATEFTQALLCKETRLPRPCKICSSCRRVASGAHPDVITVKPQGKQGYKEDDTAELPPAAAVAPFEGEYKISSSSAPSFSTAGPPTPSSRSWRSPRRASSSSSSHHNPTLCSKQCALAAGSSR